MKEDSTRLSFLLDTVALEAKHLTLTDQSLFAQPFDIARVEALAHDQFASERCDAFVARYGRLQDTVGDKLLPELLRWLAEPVSAAIDNLDKAEKLGLLSSTDAWLAARRLRNRMVHEYVREPEELAQALNQGHEFVPLLLGFAKAILAYCEARGLKVT